MMTSKIKCPVCNRELVLDFAGENYLCDNSNCVMDGVSMMQKRWESLIQIKEKLDDYKHNLSVKTEQHERGYAYATKTIKDLESKLEIATKALEKYADEDMWETGYQWEVDYIQALFLEHGYKIAKEALEQINRKED